LVAEFEEKMRKLEKDGEELNRIKASIAAKKEARQRYRNYSARVRCHLTIICLPDYSSGYGLAQKIIEEFLRRPASELEGWKSSSKRTPTGRVTPRMRAQRQKSLEELASELPYQVQTPWHLPWPVDA
jgi:hypothetical protein